MVSSNSGQEGSPQQARKDTYDVVVVGAGLGGLTAGALLAHAGKSTLVVEADELPGGYAHALRSGGYTFDRADHLLTSCMPDGPFGQGVVDAVLRELGVRDRCEFVRVDDPFYVTRYPGFECAVPCGREAFVEAHLQHFPSQARGLRRLATLSSEIYREFLNFPMRPRLPDIALIPLRYRAIARYTNATLKQVLDRELTDPRLKSVYASLVWTWLAVPPSRASFMLWAAMMGTYIDDGAYYCRGGFQRLADAFVAGLEKAGGELLLGTRVARIRTADRRVTGVELEGGQRVTASTVISAVDARATFEDLLNPDNLPARFIRRLRKREVSASVYSIYVGTDLDARALGAHHETVLAREWDIERIYADGRAGRVSGGFVVIPSMTDPSLAPAGEHVVMIQGAAPRESGETSADHRRVAADLLSLGEEVLPGLGEHLTFLEPATGESGASHPRVHRMGPIYGWTNTTANAGVRRLAPTTPVSGLLLAGHWTQPGAGMFTVVESGIQAARLALGVNAAAPPLPLGLTSTRAVRPAA
ncbi:NAD(P)/FAD-dependent oxidoreductase [Mycobacterium sp. B14F4]|uniref:phytoene desaturase family protein n=1 Tax=Mycobacterium sp. B14F4 TaxID=3153565 RepID=UPI00325E909B